MRRVDQRVLVAWLCVAAWISMIWVSSNEEFSFQTTSGVLVPFLRWLSPELSWQAIQNIHDVIRKAAHLAEYAVLAGLAFRAFRVSLDIRLGHVGVLTLAVVLAIAGLDELRQSWLPARTGSVTDVLIDLTGGAIGVVTLIGFHRWPGIRRPGTGV
jgi:VanZ family protein